MLTWDFCRCVTSLLDDLGGRNVDYGVLIRDDMQLGGMISTRQLGRSIHPVYR